MAYDAPARTAARSPASSAPGAPAVRHLPPSGRLLAAVALVALIGTGCANAPAETGSGGGEKPVTESSPSTAPEPSTAGGTGGGGDQNASRSVEKRREFAECVRENGVEEFPDPDANGIIVYDGDDPDLRSASEKCDDLQPGDRPREPGNGG